MRSALKASNGRSRFGFMEYHEIADIMDESSVYLRRWYILRTPWFGVYLHNILRPDTDRHLHDHPWNFWSFVLKGGYTESVPDRMSRWGLHRLRIWERWSVHRLRATDSHRIVHLLPHTWTLILVGRRQRDWGFWVENSEDLSITAPPYRWIQWQQYIQLRKDGVIK